MHSTLCYIEECESAELSQLCQIASAVASGTPPMQAVVTAHSQFGPELDTTVAQIESGDAEALYYAVFADFATSEWGYAPHISKQGGYSLPDIGSVVVLDRIAVWRGDTERWCWRLGTGAPCNPW